MEDFDNIYEMEDRYFLKCGNELYCEDVVYHFALKWNGNDWEEFVFDNIPKKARNISPKTASKMATIPPWKVFATSKKRQIETKKEYWENLIKTTKHKVIGYISTYDYGSDDFLSIDNGNLSHEEYAAIIKDFRENKYFYSGEDFQDSWYETTPVLDNYYWIGFSRRGFGQLIAFSLGDYSDMGYCHYTERMFINEKYLKYPGGGFNYELTSAPSEIEISAESYELIKQQIDEHIGSNEKSIPYLIAIPIPKDTVGFYWINNEVTLYHKDMKITGKVDGILNFENKETFKKFLQYRMTFIDIDNILTNVNCFYNEKDLDNPPLLLILVE